jgi:hypothetical protein
MLLETIVESDTQSINQKLLNGVAISFGCDPIFLKTVIEKCVELELFYTDENLVFSSHLQDHFEKRVLRHKSCSPSLGKSCYYNQTEQQSPPQTP